MNRDLLAALVNASAQIQAANLRAIDAGREDIAQLCRQASWKIAAAISDLAKDQAEVTP